MSKIIQGKHLHGDLFGDDVPEKHQYAVLDVIAKSPQNTFILITKNPQNVRRKMYDPTDDVPFRRLGRGDCLPNLWLGVTVENQQAADERIPALLQVPAAVRFVSCEPLLSAIDLTKWLGGKTVNDGCRKAFLCSNDNRDIQYFANGRDLAAQRAGWECQGCESKVERNSGTKGRNNTKPRSFEGSNDREWQESHGVCPSCNMDVLQQVRYSGCSGDQSQGWKPSEQSSRQFGTGDTARKHSSCGSSSEAFGQERTARGEEYKCKTYSPTGTRNTGDMEETRDVSIANCRTLQSISNHNTRYLSLQDMETSSRVIDWCIVGGETGPGARPCHPDWVRSLRDQCQAAKTPFLFAGWDGCGDKSAGRLLDGQIWDEYPEED